MHANVSYHPDIEYVRNLNPFINRVSETSAQKPVEVFPPNWQDFSFPLATIPIADANILTNLTADFYNIIGNLAQGIKNMYPIPFSPMIQPPVPVIEEKAEVVKPKKTFISNDELFNHVIEYVLEDEGGFVNHPKDKGGITNMGITKKWYDANMGRVSTIEEFRNLTKEDAKEYYYKFYWKTLLKQIPELNEYGDARLTYLTFDTMLHSGLAKAKELFNAEKNKNTSTEEKAYAMLDTRRNYLDDISQPGTNNEVFNKGWAWRMDKIEDRFSAMA